MRSASLLLVFVLAKLVIVWGHAAPVTGWSLLAYVWQDVMVALVFGAFDIALQRIRGATRIVWAIYWAIAIYAAINIPVGRVVSTPLTRPMLRAARGPLADSLLIYLTATNILLLVSVMVLAAGLPWLLRGVLRCEPRKAARLTLIVGIAGRLLGPTVYSRTDTRGMDRNVLTSLFGT